MGAEELQAGTPATTVDECHEFIRESGASPASAGPVMEPPRCPAKLPTRFMASRWSRSGFGLGPALPGAGTLTLPSPMVLTPSRASRRGRGRQNPRYQLPESAPGRPILQGPGPAPARAQRHSGSDATLSAPLLPPRNLPCLSPRARHHAIPGP